MEQILAYLFDFFKAKSPKLAGILMLVLGTAFYFFTSPEATGLLGETGAAIGKWVAVVWLALQGSRTTDILYPTLKKTPEQKK